MAVVVADATPLIFLGKVNQLALLRRLFGEPVVIPLCIRDEVLPADLPPHEERVLSEFLRHCEIVRVSRPRLFARSLSQADNKVVTLAVRRKADWVLADDHLLRKMAAIEGIAVMGTLGVLLQAENKRLLSASQTADLIDALVSEHALRISIRVYETAMRRLRTT
ncbi:MAG: DUF3368 domain-containing protein [Kiritimatiellae bacterium]|nr:DUF3368 domain-containing protein [Kiritimatiellia bacterium]